MQGREEERGGSNGALRLWHAGRRRRRRRWRNAVGGGQKRGQEETEVAGVREARRVVGGRLEEAEVWGDEEAVEGQVGRQAGAYCEAAPPLGCLPARLPRLTSSLLRGSTHCVSWELNNCRGGGEHTQ